MLAISGFVCSWTFFLSGYVYSEIGDISFLEREKQDSSFKYLRLFFVSMLQWYELKEH